MQLTNDTFGNEAFLKLLLDSYGQNGSITTEGITNLLQSIVKNAATLRTSNKTETNCSLNAFDANNSADVFSSEQFASLLPALVFNLQDTHCSANVTKTEWIHPNRPSIGEVWMYGFLCVTAINLCALFGLIFLPLMKQRVYHHVLLFMVALAVGTLCGTALLVLLPECLGMVENERYYLDEYIWKATGIMAGIYMFYLVEKVLRHILNWWQKRSSSTAMLEEQLAATSVPMAARSHTESLSIALKVPDDTPPSSSRRLKHCNESQLEQLCQGDQQLDAEDETPTKLKQTTNGHAAVLGGSQQLSPREIKGVAWMVIFGDGVHNFIDGLSIGAAFAEHIVTGITVSMAVFCEELPHELGDFAVLLQAGMSVKQALLFNFLSACLCYLGLAIGIAIGELSDGSSWIFALAAGMFLYISLVDMLPEANHAAEEEMKKTGKKWLVVVLQNAGMVAGFGLVLLFTRFSYIFSVIVPNN